MIYLDCDDQGIVLTASPSAEAVAISDRQALEHVTPDALESVRHGNDILFTPEDRSYWKLRSFLVGEIDPFSAQAVGDRADLSCDPRPRC